MNKSVAIIVGGTGQFGRILTKKLIKKNYKVVVTTRSLSKAKLKSKFTPKINFFIDDTFDEAEKIEKLLWDKKVLRDLNE